MARGNQGGDIDADDRDRKLWLETLGDKSCTPSRASQCHPRRFRPKLTR